MLQRKNFPPSPRRQKIGEAVTRRIEANPGFRRANITSAQVYFYHDFLGKADCDLLMRSIDAGSRKSTLLAAAQDPSFRNSDSTDLDRWSLDIGPIDTRIADLLGIAPDHAETMQGQRYAPGQQFRAHHDWFHQDQPYWQRMMDSGGQRTWTAMVFLNTVTEGGATWFPQAGIRVKPKPGLLLVWNNMNPDGSPNQATLHEGMAVVKGTKYIVTKWFREDVWLR